MGEGMQEVRTLLLSPYWSFWEDAAGDIDLRADRHRVLTAAAADLAAESLTVAGAHLVEPAMDPPRLEQPDVVVVAVTMAAPPTPVLAVLEQLDAATPVVVWSLLQPEHAGASTETIVRDGATVGAPLLTSALHRAERPYSIIAGPRSRETAGRISLVARALHLARTLKDTRLGRIGDPIPGYVAIDAPDADLTRAFGVRPIRIAPEELRMSAAAVTDDARAVLERELPAETAERERLDLRASLALRQALRDVSARHGLAGGAINCHGPDLRFHEDVGITPCYALGMETTAGSPWTCTGDILTTLAMLIAKRLSGAALYHEIESIDPDSGQCVLANSGEFDLCWSSGRDDVQAQANPWFRSDPKVGLSVAHDLRPGPATLVAVVGQPDHPSGFRLVTASGEVLPGRPGDLPTAGGLFRFASGDAIATWERWIEAGAGHHSALARGAIAEGVQLLAGRLGVDSLDVCQPGG